MKYIIMFCMLVIFAVSCSENKPVSTSFYDQGVDYAVEGQFKKAKNSFTDALNDENDGETSQQSLKVVEDVLSQGINAEAAVNFFKGIKFGNNGELLHAFTYFSNAINIAPDFATAYYERGLINGRLNYFKKAIADFTRAIELNPNDVIAVNNRGLAYAKGLGRYDEAIKDFNLAIDLDPEFADSYINRGIAYSKSSDDSKKACADWKRACDLGRCQSFTLSRESGYCK